jgi:hypothetical protein
MTAVLPEHLPGSRRRRVRRLVDRLAPGLAATWTRVRRRSPTPPPWLGRHLTDAWRATLEGGPGPVVPGADPVQAAKLAALTCPVGHWARERTLVAAGWMGLGLRTPYYDRDLVDAALRVPADSWVPRARYRELQLDVVRPFLHPDVAARRRGTSFEALRHVDADTRALCARVILSSPDAPRWLDEGWLAGLRRSGEAQGPLRALALLCQWAAHLAQRKGESR